MIKTDVLIFGNRAWSVVEPGDEHTRLRLLAGPDGEVRTQRVLTSMLQGRPVYRLMSAIDDIDLDLAREEVAGSVDVTDFGNDPRKWAEAFVKQFGARPCPDATIVLGWFSEALRVSAELAQAKPRARPAARAKLKPKAAKSVAAKAGKPVKSAPRALPPPPRPSSKSVILLNGPAPAPKAAQS